MLLNFYSNMMATVIEIGLILLASFATGMVQGQFVHNDLDYLYPIYKLIDNAVKNDHKLMFKMNQVFFPAMNFRFGKLMEQRSSPLMFV